VGVALFCIGFFKKVFIADPLAQFVAPVFDPDPAVLWSSGPPTLLTAWAAVLAYTLQLYFDFSGYSDMALGAARLLGIRLPMNFNSPYKAASIIEFWSRWHITLTRFLTSYIYTPLALAIARARRAKGKSTLRGTRSSASSIAMSVWLPTLTTMTTSGLWHGAGWQFVMWGLLHGMYLSINQSWRLLRPRLWRDPRSYSRIMQPVGVVFTCSAVVVALIFFRARSVGAALSILNALMGGNGLVPHDVMVLRQVGVELPSSILSVFFPASPWIWIACLLLWIALLPNSLEILRDYGPAVDYPQDTREPDEPAHAKRADAPAAARRPALHLGRVRVPLERTAGVVAALMSVLGILMLNSGQAFIYWNF